MTSSGTGVALATQGLAKRYGSRVALDGLDLRVPEGVVYGFLGSQRRRQDDDDADPHRPHPPRRRAGRAARPAVRAARPAAPVRGRGAHRVAGVLPVPVGPREPARARRDRRPGARQPASTSCWSWSNLRERAGDKVSGYSLGMKQRLGIAAALLSDPRLLLLDEPANGLDPAGIVGMRDTLRALAAAGKTVFVSSHILSEVQQLVDVVGIIARGRLVREGPVEDLLREAGLDPHPRRARRGGRRGRGAGTGRGGRGRDARLRTGGGLAHRPHRSRPWRRGQPGARRAPGSTPRGSRRGRRSRACSSSSPVPTRT